MTLRIGTELVKKRGGASKRVRFVGVEDGRAMLQHISRADARRSDRVRGPWPVEFGEDGIPVGYRLAEVRQ
jgi:hypothetical protein